MLFGCVHTYVHILMCALKLNTCWPLPLMGAKTCLRSDEGKLNDENDTVILSPERKKACGCSQDQLRNSFRLTEGNDDGAEFPPEKRTSAGTKIPFTF